MARRIKLACFLIFAVSFLSFAVKVDSYSGGEDGVDSSNLDQGYVTLTGSFIGDDWITNCYNTGGLSGEAIHPRSVELDSVYIIDSNENPVPGYSYNVILNDQYFLSEPGRDSSCPGSFDNHAEVSYTWYRGFQISTVNLPPGTYTVVGEGIAHSGASEPYTCLPGDCDPNLEGTTMYDGYVDFYHPIGNFIISAATCKDNTADNYNGPAPCVYHATGTVTSNLPTSWTVTDGGGGLHDGSGTASPYGQYTGPSGTWSIQAADLDCYSKAVYLNDGVTAGTSQSIADKGTKNFNIVYTNDCGGSTAPDPDLRFNGQQRNATIDAGQSGTLAWTVAGGAADSCTATSTPSQGTWSGGKSTDGGSENSGVINGQVTFLIQCTNIYGTGQSQVIVTITGSQPIYGCTDPTASNYNSLATVDDGSCIPPTNNAPYGSLDIHDCQYAGWAYDPDTPNGLTNGQPGAGAVTVNVYKDGHVTRVDSFKAYGYRGDLPGDRNHSFGYISAPASLDDGTHTLNFYAVDTTSGHEASTPFGSYTYNFYGCANHPATGQLDVANCSTFGGWAYDPDSENTSIEVHLYKDSTYVGALTANEPRSDVNQIVGITGDHGFGDATMDVFKDGQSHAFNAKAVDYNSGIEYQLGSSPKTVTCPHPTVDLSLDDHSLAYNKSTTIRWAVSNADSCTTPAGGDNPNGNWTGSKSASGGSESTGNLLGPNSFTYKMTCTNSYGSSTDSDTLTVGGPAAPTCTLSASSTSLPWNNTGTNLSWTSDGAPLVTALNATGNWSGSKTPLSAGTQNTGHLEPGTYSYTLTATGPGGTAQCGPAVNISVSPSSPNLPGITATAPNFCVTGPNGETISWTYVDPSGSPETAYQLQVFQGSNLFYDTGKVANSGTSKSLQDIPTLQWGTTYKAQVRVWNSYNSDSNWSGFATWSTPPYAYPQVGMSWSPKSPGKAEPVQFTDKTVFGGGSANARSWYWSFGDGNTSPSQNPVHTYANTGSYPLTLTVTDAAGQSCGTTGYGTIQGNDDKTCNANCGIDIQKPIPEIKEVAPK